VKLTSLPAFLSARRLVADYMAPTPLVPADLTHLGRADGLFTKHENLTPIRSFKVRGALCRLKLLSAEERAAGVVTASTGNHGMAVAFAARKFGTSAVVVVPERASALKTDGIKRLGAEVRTIGSVVSDAETAAKNIAEEEGRVLIVDGDDLAIMIGAGTVSLEILEALPEAQVLLVPVGSGNLIAGMASCAKLINPQIEVIGIQSTASPCVYESLKAARPTHVPSATFAGGLAADHPYGLAFSVLKEVVDDIVLVADDDIRRAMALALTEIGQVLEGAGAAPLAALAPLAERLEGKVVVAVLTGGNVEIDELSRGLLTVRGVKGAQAALPERGGAVPAVGQSTKIPSDDRTRAIDGSNEKPVTAEGVVPT
jgi:threonine dehydratase